MAEYVLSFSVDTGVLLPVFGKALAEVNDAMNGFGFPERLVSRSNVISINLRNVRDLWPQEIRELSITMEREFRAKLPRYDVRYEGCRKL